MCVSNAAKELAISAARGEAPFLFDFHEIQEEGSEIAAREIAKQLHGDSSHQAFLNNEWKQVGMPTTVIELEDGTKADTRSLGSYGTHRFRNNRLKPSVLGSNMSDECDKKRPALNPLDSNCPHPTVNGLPEAAYDIGPFAVSNENGTAATNAATMSSSCAKTPAQADSKCSPFLLKPVSNSSFELPLSGQDGKSLYASMPTMDYGGSNETSIDLTGEDAGDPVVLQMLDLLLDLSLQESGMATVLNDENAGSPIGDNKANKANRRVTHLLQDRDTAYLVIEQAMRLNPTATPEAVAHFYDVFLRDK